MADAGGEPGQDDLCDAAAAQLQVEVGSVEGTPGALGHCDVVRVAGEIIDDDIPAFGQGTGQARGFVATWRGIRSVRTGRDPHQDDRGAVFVEGAGQLDRPGHDLGAGVGGRGSVDDGVLQVDDDQRAGRVECGDGHELCLSAWAAQPRMSHMWLGTVLAVVAWLHLKAAVTHRTPARSHKR